MNHDGFAGESTRSVHGGVERDKFAQSLIDPIVHAVKVVDYEKRPPFAEPLLLMGSIVGQHQYKQLGNLGWSIGPIFCAVAARGYREVLR